MKAFDTSHPNSFNSRSVLEVGGRRYLMFRLDSLEGIDISRLPYCLKILLENLLRREDGVSVTKEDILALANWSESRGLTTDSRREISYQPARTLLQDFTGVPAIVDLAAMRDAMKALGGDPKIINPLQPVELVVDHSIQVDFYGTPEAFEKNSALDYERNTERYSFLRWGQEAFANFKVVPPNTGICHQVNLEYLARVVFSTDEQDVAQQHVPPENSVARQSNATTESLPLIYPDTCVGTDSHTPMVNGLGILAWGVGGIEAEAAMLGQPISMLIPQVVGVRLSGELSAGATATDLVLTITELLRKEGVVSKFVEFFGPGVASLSVADRATIGNMTPEYGATCAIFPPDQATIDYLRLTGRSESRIALIETYLKEQNLFHDLQSPEAVYSVSLALDLSTVEPCVAGPKRPQDRIPLAKIGHSFKRALPDLLPGRRAAKRLPSKESSSAITDGSVVIAAITSCTNTSNPSVMMAAGLLAKKAVQLGLRSQPWVRTSLAPGSKVVTRYFEKSGLDQFLNQLGFTLAGYGCTTCIGNSGPLDPRIATEIQSRDLVVASVLSGNRNFEGRINPDVRANFLMSPPLVVAFAIVGRVQWDPTSEPLGVSHKGEPVYLKDIWPSQTEIEQTVRSAIDKDMYQKTYETVYDGDKHWSELSVTNSELCAWNPNSTYIQAPPYFQGMAKEEPSDYADILGARVIAFLGDSVTTDHISPAGSIAKDSPAGIYLQEKGVAPKDFNSYGSRRGNHQVMVRGTFANGRIRNRLAPETEGGFTTYFADSAAGAADKRVMPIFDAAELYRQTETPLCVLAGKEYGSGSSRDWAAKGPLLQGIKFVIAESYERIHRSNLIGMGILPLQFAEGTSAESLGLTGEERIDIADLNVALADNFAANQKIKVKAYQSVKKAIEFEALIRLDTPQERLYYLHGGILKFVLRQMLSGKRVNIPLPGGLNTAPQSERDKTGLDHAVHESSNESFPASDPAAY